MTEITRRSLDLVFGDSSRGLTPKDRAATSERMFVRSQVQLAPYSDGARGRVLSAQEALGSYGFSALLEAAVEGFYPLVRVRSEPSTTLRRRREDLNLSHHAVSVSSGVSEAEIKKAEQPGSLSPIRKLQRIAEALAIDERQIGVTSGSGADTELGVRLRESDWQRDVASFSERSVTDLAEAAWVISRQAELMQQTPVGAPELNAWAHLRSDDYRYQSWERGYELAARTREFFGLSQTEPVLSLRELIDDQLRIPLVQIAMHERLAGATIANGSHRGIVVNELGRNSNVWVRRMTLAHEVGHLVGDPDYRLNKLRVDDYDVIEKGTSSQTRDPVEMRANGFAVAFLAPPKGVNEIALAATSDSDRLRNVMNTFGISKTAAVYHIWNVTKIDLRNVYLDKEDLIPEDHWAARENATVDYPPWPETPISRRGLFTLMVVRSECSGLISKDTAAEWLRVTPARYEERRPVVESFYK